MCQGLVLCVEDSLSEVVMTAQQSIEIVRHIRLARFWVDKVKAGGNCWIKDRTRFEFAEFHITEAELILRGL